jgi:hypothetical protein
VPFPVDAGLVNLGSDLQIGEPLCLPLHTSHLANTMPDSYPYIISNNKIEPILSRVRSAAKPTRFSRETLNNWGFTASNDRAMVGVLKELGFLTENGTPTEFYDRLRDPNDWRYVLGERMRDLYADLFAIDTSINVAPDGEIRGAISRVTGKDDETVRRYYSTFKALAGLAKFEPRPTRGGPAVEERSETPGEEERQRVSTPPSPPAAVHTEHEPRRKPDFHYNIQIHLPVTTDITVYNAIFKSLKDTLNI